MLLSGARKKEFPIGEGLRAITGKKRKSGQKAACLIVARKGAKSV